MRERVNKLIELTTTTCIPWIQERDGVVQFIDPIENMEISAHYGASHAAVALIIYGKEINNLQILNRGEVLLTSVIERWNQSKRLPGFHNDFNNFALCVLDSYTDKYHDRIEKIILETSDSNHDTINWLPMRWYVNKCRYRWTGKQEYQEVCETCAEKIKKATYNDGFIDDRLPVGMSFNLQYDVATVAVMQFLRVGGESLDLSKEMGALLNAVCSDGDINYLGRGTNQIFAWGLWIYLLASGGLDEIERALDYLDKRLPTTLQNNNIMLNDYLGEEKFMWWDYHYCSVYTAHLLFWLVLAWKDYSKKSIKHKLIVDGSSGLRIIKNDKLFIAIFKGRSEYLSERGPVVAAIWTQEKGSVCKGTFGPWLDPFGNKYLQAECTIKNNCGLFKADVQGSFVCNRYVKKLFPNRKSEKKISLQPFFSEIEIKENNNNIEIAWQSNSHNHFIWSIPSLCCYSPGILIVDGKEIRTDNTQMIRNQYGWNYLFTTKYMNGNNWIFRIPLEG